mmetsp:Transcript_18201/g.43271  ORF Transcript_18201/g.43271 Transcript_18201/m.43271 type:complete len:217 (+) Transcript_18201:301-951(+)
MALRSVSSTSCSVGGSTPWCTPEPTSMSAYRCGGGVESMMVMAQNGLSPVVVPIVEYDIVHTSFAAPSGAADAASRVAGTSVPPCILRTLNSLSFSFKSGLACRTSSNRVLSSATSLSSRQASSSAGGIAKPAEASSASDTPAFSNTLNIMRSCPTGPSSSPPPSSSSGSSPGRRGNCTCMSFSACMAAATKPAPGSSDAATRYALPTHCRIARTP